MSVMKKIKIKIAIVGFLPFKFGEKLFRKWKSDVFEIVGDIGEYHIQAKFADTHTWGYSDNSLENELPTNENTDFLIGITYVPLENNYYARRLSGNRIVLSYFQMYDILRQEHISVENFLLREIYGSVLVYLRNGKIPLQIVPHYFHHDTRGCIFDMNGHKGDVVFSLDRPKICDGCVEEIRRDRVSDNYINRIRKEIKRIRKGRLYRIFEYVEKKPKRSLIASGLTVIVLNLVSNVIWWLFKLIQILCRD
jgi:hypothetical protein